VHWENKPKRKNQNPETGFSKTESTRKTTWQKR